MILIKQKHECGCVVACLAMALGICYDRVVSESGINPKFGAQRWQWQNYLRRKQYRGYLQEYDINGSRPSTWAAVHFCSIYEGGLQEKGHMVLVYLGRHVYDPCKDQIYSYDDLSFVRMLAAIYPPPFMQARLLSGLMES